MSIDEKEIHTSGEKALASSSSDLKDEFVGILNEFHKQKLYEKLGHGNVQETDADGNVKELHVEDADYLFTKIDELPISKAVEDLHEIIEEHDDDPNLPEEDYNEIVQLAKGVEENKEMGAEEWAFRTKMYAGLYEYHSLYPEVRSISSPVDDPSIPVETFRAYLLAFIWTIIGTGVNEFFSHRYPSIGISSSIIQMLLYPCGKFVERVLPDWGFTFRGVRHTLNPGPWSYKEQMFATIVFNVAIGGTYVSSNIMVQKMDVYYGSKWVSLGYQIFLTLSTQFMGFGFAGLLRKVAIYPVRAVWPTLLPSLALNRALLKTESKEKIHGWTISRYYFFFIVSSCAFIYFWFPNYIFQALSTFNWMTWIKPDNFNLAVVTGSVSGLGLNPLPSFDWNVIGNNSPLSVPFYSLCNQFAGMMIGFFAILGVYYSNYKWTGYFPINSNKSFDNQGRSYRVTKLLTNGKFDNEKYQKYSPPYYSAANLVLYGAFFAIYPFSFVYTLYLERKSVWRSIKTLKTSLTSFNKSNFEHFKDPHSRMMSKYKETPDWWFIVVLLVSIAFGIICVKAYPANTPVWGIFFTLAINFVFLVPLTLIYSVTGFSFGLNVLVELIIGYAIPNNGDALMTLKALGYNIGGQAENYITDQKMAHYAKVPPLAIFRGQIISTFIQIIVSLAVTNFTMSNIEGICTPKQANKMTCPGETTFYTASIFWGVIGPKRVFGGLYPVLKYCFLIGFLLAPVCIAARKYFPTYTKRFQPTIVIGGMLGYAPYNLTYIIPGMYVGYIFNHYIKKRYLNWWEKYNYVLAAALTAGTSFSALIIFFAVQYKDKPIDWWGNNVSYEGYDGQAFDRISYLEPASAPDGYVGLRYGNFP